MTRADRFLAWLFMARDEDRPAVGVDPDHGNLHSLAEMRARRELRTLEALTPRVCCFCGERGPSHDLSCPNHAWSRHGFDSKPWEGRKGD